MSLELEVHTANAENGEPLVVVRIGEAVTLLPLLNAMELGEALIEAVAKSTALTPDAKPVSRIKLLN